MSKLLTTFKGWSSRRQQPSLERWAQERAKGKGRFVLRQAFTFAVFMTAVRDVTNHIRHEDARVTSLWFNIIGYALTGVVIGYVAWWYQEGKYKDAQLNGSLPTSFDNRITPR